MKYIIIVGCGKTGKELAIELAHTENVVMVDKNLKQLDFLGDDFNGKKIWGDGLDMHTLEDAGVKEADALFLLTGNDNLNIVVGKVVKRKYGVKSVILQINDVVKKKIFQEEGLTIVNRTYLIVEVLKKCIS
ncbi:MAG: TrkA family potassium uptake protein [Candidatus Omnitrophota bacterium]|nr:MAG: TrkA family potassium uptake protein [Candidatus Omnitrophota bacterium]